MKALLACISLSVACVAQADTVLDYNVLHAGKESGAQKTVIQGDGRMHVSYSYRDNGRGPDIEEDIALLPDGSFKSYRQTGKTTYGAALNERFSISGRRASWQSPAERGSQELTGPAVYLPGYGSPETNAIIVRATQNAGGRLAALPGGELRSEKLASARVGPAGKEREVALYAILGAGLQPDYVWIESAGGMPLFASINVGGSHMVVAGYEGAAPELERLQQQAETKYLEDLAKKHIQELAQPILIKDVRVFDAKTKALGEPADVYVNEGRIAAIYPAGSPAKDPATVIEGAGRALLPGLFDMHTHEDAWNAALQIAGGVTSSRDMGNDNDYLARLRADIAAGRAIGPHIEPAGYIEGESPFASRGGFVVASVAEAEHAVDWYAERGYRQVKLYNSIKPEWAGPIAAYAHSRGLRVSGHVPAFSRSERVTREGYDELQHINQLMLNFVSDPDTDSRTIVRFNLVGERSRNLDLDSKAVKDFIALLAERQTVIDATMATFEGTWNQKPGDMDPSLAAIADHVPFATQRAWRNNSTDVSGGRLEVYRASWKRMMEFLGRLHAAGVPLVAGTDSLAGFMLHRELELYVQAGVPPGEAVRIATENGARYAGVLADRGTVERGKRADLIRVDGDPTKNISDIRKVSYVLKDGTGFAPAEIYESFGIRRFTEPPAITR
ncbi:MAG TPA: amidohydrolase family protein [Steroidobacteraceae bacterium]|nr:amidohydrolase family protein [Steroidobacteraceae bacterium]